MTEQFERRLKQDISYDAIVDRRRNKSGPPRVLEWPPEIPAIPGMIRPGVRDEWDGVERRSVPEAG